MKEPFESQLGEYGLREHRRRKIVPYHPTHSEAAPEIPYPYIELVCGSSPGRDQAHRAEFEMQ